MTVRKMKKRFTKHYPLLTVNGKDIGMNVRFSKGTKYWSFQCCPDARLDEPFNDRVFRYLCEIDGIMYSLNRAFYDFRDFGRCRQGSLWLSAVWLSGKSLTWEHVEHILESVLPHWQKAGKTIENWLVEQKVTLDVSRDMMNELYDPEQYSKYYTQYNEWSQERFLMRKKRKNKGKSCE